MSASGVAEPIVIIRRSLFFVVLIALTLGNLFPLFRGLEGPQAMDQAQIAREIARGNGFTTKFIRPAAYAQVRAAKSAVVPFTKFEDTYHAPLNPLINGAVLKLVGADDPEGWPMGKNEELYRLDRVIAAVSTFFFLISIGVTYLLVTRIFDARIGTVTAILMLFCETLWRYSLSGLPQMLMLMLFSCALYFTYRAVEAGEDGRPAMMPGVIAGVFLCLLTLSHWMAVWPVVGFLVFAAIAFRPRGLVALTVLGIVLLPAVFIMVRNHANCGSSFGVAYLTLNSGLTGSEEDIMRGLSLEHEIPLNSLVSKILRITLLQGTQIIPLLAGIVVAPLYFLALLHPFKRGSIATFRWAVLAMWLATAIGLAFFGVKAEGIDPNQLHLLFAPIMTAYGLALISIMWNRLDFVSSAPFLRHAHYIAVIGMCALPLLLSLPDKIKLGIIYRDRQPFIHWPPYRPKVFARELKSVVPENQMIYSDQPWAVAWYADRISMWLPRDASQLEEVETDAITLNTPPAGILITPASYGEQDMLTLRSKYGDLTTLVTDGQTLINTASASGAVSIFDKDPKIATVVRRYPNRYALLGYYMSFYSANRIRFFEPD